ncbi:hypothetical protein UFOVP1516_43 [uncultured Caudovirales phage]|uniref:Uncharacterized protein n=1 Tax=uncultured Caudovirales phage TaxID=2100421 RepID=A0A6J5PI51_9CAUD|nr:hypothetical protein UFOVP887_1 [uncultured Caudovirales phage]CAB5226856.1 hypothetical protein UFOVP1516_43 [uncultured Caudovirales phage]
MATLNFNVNDPKSFDMPLPEGVVIPDYSKPKSEPEPKPESEPNQEIELEQNHAHSEWRAEMKAKGIELSDLTKVVSSTPSQSPFEQAKSEWREATTKRKQILAELDYEVLQARKKMDSFR